MKKLLLIITLSGISVFLFSQTWNAQIERVTGTPKLKTVRIKPGTFTTVGTRLQETDSLKETRFFDGDFLSGNADSIALKLSQVRLTRNFSNGTKQSFTIPAKQYFIHSPADTSLMRIPVSEIHYIDYYTKKWRKRAEGGEIIVLGSLLALVLSPFICYDYQDGQMNAEKYKNWALGSTIGIVAGITSVITINSFSKHKTFEFRSGWTDRKKAEVWKFQ